MVLFIHTLIIDFIGIVRVVSIGLLVNDILKVNSAANLKVPKIALHNQICQ